jgi:tRNA pseudouridine38-40 synthase
MMEEAINKLTGERVRVKMAGRTDTGVHARGQVVSFRTDSPLPQETFVRGLNHYLPEDIAVKEAYRVEDSLEVRRHATSREYRYSIVNSCTRSPLRKRHACQVPEDLDIEAMSRACRLLVGKHDFASFVTSKGKYGKSTIREIYRAEAVREGDTVTITIAASSFLPHQVRNMVGTLIRVGQNKMTVEEFKEVLEARAPGRGGPTAPAHGLCLEKVSYPVPLGER